MVVPLGPTIRTPAFLILQITLCLSIFYVSLSVSYVIERLIMWLLSAALTPKRMLLPIESLSALLTFHVTDLFRVNASTDTYVSFFVMHMLCACISSKYLAKVLQRSKDIIDNVRTIYLLHYMITIIVLRKVIPGGILYFLVLGLSGAVSILLLRKRITEAEIAEIRITPV